MPSQNDFSITAHNNYLGNDQTVVITGNGITSFQDATLRILESIIRNSGYSDYTISTLDTAVNTRIYWDDDLAVPQTNSADDSVILTALMKNTTGAITDTVGSPADITSGSLNVLIDKILPKAYKLFREASKNLAATVAEADCATEGTGRYQGQIGECIYDICVIVQ